MSMWKLYDLLTRMYHFKFEYVDTLIRIKIVKITKICLKFLRHL